MTHKKVIKLHSAKYRKYDEFYTRYEDVEKELKHYKDHFQGKVVYCNCDSVQSNFVRYFIKNFVKLGLKKLIATHYIDQNIDFFTTTRPDKTRLLITTYCPIQRIVKNSFHTLKGNGSFKSPECVEYLKQADIVITNPPFSLFRDFIALMMQNHKKFLILGNIGAAIYRDIFPYMQNDTMRLGVQRDIKDFEVPDDYYLKNHKMLNGKKVASFGIVRWFTNMQHGFKPTPKLDTKYDPAINLYYDNYNAVEVSSYNLIPHDWPGMMGAPVTLMDVYNPDLIQLIDAPSSSLSIANKAMFKRIIFRLCRHAHKPLPVRDKYIFHLGDLLHTN